MIVINAINAIMWYVNIVTALSDSYNNLCNWCVFCIAGEAARSAKKALWRDGQAVASDTSYDMTVKISS